MAILSGALTCFCPPDPSPKQNSTLTIRELIRDQRGYSIINGMEWRGRTWKASQGLGRDGYRQMAKLKNI
jgi:hypothetical protein